jgi:hypothetical protein
MEAVALGLGECGVQRRIFRGEYKERCYFANQNNLFII